MIRNRRYGALLTVALVLILALIVGVMSSYSYSEYDEQDFFNPANFSQQRQPLTLNAQSVPHGQIAVNYIKHINDNFYDRFSYTLQEMHTAAWIVEELLAMGYTWSDIEVQEFMVGNGRSLDGFEDIMDFFIFIDYSPFANIGTRPSQQSQNIILTIPGQSEEVIVIGAHYDSVFFPGASDNASGVALLLESAQRMMNLENYYTLEYVFFGAEEVGLLGSFYYVDSLTQAEHDNILFMINADMLLDGEDLFYMAGYDADGQPGTNHITESWDYIAQELNAHYDLNLLPLPWGVFGPSDQLAFLPFGHTAMFLAGLDVDVMPQGDINKILMDISRVYHSPRDNIQYINDAWPDKMETNMKAFSFFLEELLLSKYYED